MRSIVSIGRVFAYILAIIAGASLAIFQVHIQSLRKIPMKPAENFMQVAYVVPVFEETVTLEELSQPEDDTALIARVVQAEAGNQPFVGKVAVAMTILNRMDMYEQTAEEVIYADGQYASPASIWDEESERAVEFAKENRELFDSNMIYFRTKYYHSFGEPYCIIGSHYFSCEVSEDAGL